MRYRLLHAISGCQTRWVLLEEVDRFISRFISQCRMCGETSMLIVDERTRVGRHKDYSLS